MKRFAFVLAACVAVGCGPSPAAVSPESPRIEGITIVFTKPEPDRLPFDPRAARLVTATHQLTFVAGRPLTFQIDAALVPQWRSSFEEALIEAIESTATGLAHVKAISPRVFAHGAKLFDRIECLYSATARHPEAKVDLSSHAIVVTVPAGSSRFVGPNEVGGALRDEYASYLTERYARAEPDRIPKAEQGPYFEYLTDQARAPNHGSASLDEEGEVLVKVTRLYDLARGDAELEAEIRELLIQRRHYFLLEYQNHEDRVRAARADSAFRRAEAAWARWLTTYLLTFRPEDKDVIARDLLPSRGVHGRGVTIQGFDAFGFGLALADEWARAGHPKTETDKRFEAIDGLICPQFADAEGRLLSRGRSCSDGFYALAMETPENRKRLADALVSRNDPDLTRTVIVNLKRTPLETTLSFVRLFEPHPAVWNVAARVLAEEIAIDRGTHEAFLNESIRIWRASPDRRGMALYLLAQSHRNLDSYWDKDFVEFASMFGAPIGEAELASFLDVAPMSLVPALFPAFGKGWSRAAVLAPRLDRFLDRPASRTDPEASRTVALLVDRLCKEGNVADLSRLHAYFQGRVAGHREDAQRLANAIEDTGPGRCAGRR